MSTPISAAAAAVVVAAAVTAEAGPAAVATASRHSRRMTFDRSNNLEGLQIKHLVTTDLVVCSIE